MLSRNKSLYPSVGYGKIGGSSDGQQPPVDGLTYVNGVPAQLDIHVFDKVTLERIASTKSGIDGTWGIEGLSTSGGFFAVFENKEYRDAAGNLIESAIRYDLKAEPIPLNEAEISGIRNASPFSDGFIYDNYPNSFTVAVNTSTKNITTTNEVYPVGMQLSAGHGQVTLSGAPITQNSSYTISFQVDGELYQTVFLRKPQRRGYDPKLLFAVDFNHPAGTTSIPYRTWCTNSTMTLTPGTNSNGISNDAPYSSDLYGSLDLTSGVGIGITGVYGNALTKRSGGVVELIIKPTEIQTTHAIIFAETSSFSSPNTYVIFYLEANTNRLMMGNLDTLGGNIGLDLGVVIPTGQWTHILICQDVSNSGKNRLFINGAFVHDNVPDINWGYEYRFLIGAKPTAWSSAWTSFRGYIASIACYAGLPVQYTTFEKRTKPFIERGYTEICSDFSTGFSDQAWANWTVTAGTPTFSDGLVITPGTVVSTAADIYLPQSGMIEFYVTPTSIGTFQPWLGASNNAGIRFECGITAAGEVWFARRNSEATAEVKTTTTLTAGVEYHIAVCYDGPRKTHKIFINGVESASYTYGSNSSSISLTNLQFNIGQGRNNTTTGTTQTRTMDAKIRGLRVLAGSGYYEANFTPPTFSDLTKPIYAIYPEFRTPDFAPMSVRAGECVDNINLELPARYWRVLVTENGGTGGPGIGTPIYCGELEMYETVGGTNTALTATPLISVVGSGAGSEIRLNDGLTSPAAYTVASAGAAGYWFGYDYGSDPADWKVIRYVRYNVGPSTNAAQKPTDYQIQYSHDGSTWNTVHSGSWVADSTANVWNEASF